MFILVEMSHTSFLLNEDNQEKLDQRLSDVLSINENDLADEFDRFRNMAKQGTCEWIGHREWFKDWLCLDMDTPRILWISGAPAAGKSVLAAATVDKIRNIYGQGSCQYHNLSFADKSKRSASYLLRSLAFQIAHSKPLFRKKLLQFSEEFRIPFGHMNANILWEKIFPGLLFQLMPERPLYWVIDGLDESDSISTIFQCLNKIESDSLTLKVMLVSRPTADITMRVKSLAPLKFHMHLISLADTEGDIRSYVNDLVPSIVPGEESDHRSIINKILSKASGNFLWVVLVLKALEQNWYTKSDIDRAIQEFHSEMTPIYANMMRKLDEQIPRNRKMTSLILIWATFSFRPLSVVELRTALKPEFEGLTSLEDIVRHVCGGFVQVRGSKVGLIHETAKHFLINETVENKIQMTPSKGHEYLAIACLQHLSSTKERQWRTLLKHVEDSQEATHDDVTWIQSAINQNHPFLMYTATSWAYHLSFARTESLELQSALFEFLKRDTLTWIHTLALSGDLKTLIRSAKYLKTFIKRREKAREEARSANFQNDDLENLRSWAVDLSRLVGKFGSSLLLSPSSIYKHIPPFCPENSMIRKLFGRTNNSFSVIGISNPDWDDCHARLSVDPDDSASRLLATVDIFAALIPQAHSLVIWHAETCEEIRRINHEEYLIEIAINKKGDHICTAGIHTIKIWDVGTGSQLASNPKTSDTHIIALAFGRRDDEILVGYQDYTVTCYKWRTYERIFDFHACTEGEIYGGLRVMKFSPNGTQVAFGSKGIPVEIWDLRRQTRAHRCMIEQDATRPDSEHLLPPEAIQWHPELERVYILYHNMRLVDWNPTFEEQTEYQIGAKEMICSPCGNFLLTADNCGAIRIFSLPDYVSEQDQKFRLIYYLECDELVRDLAFHPDGQRFYDIRGTICNVWEPEALVQADEPGTEEGSSNAGSLMSSGPAEAFQEDRSQITAIASDPREFGFCCGRNDGTLSIHEMKRGKRLRSLPGHATDAAIISLKWSHSGNWIASADDSGHVLVRKVQIPSTSHPNLLIWKASDFRVEDGIVQLLISPDDKYLLVGGSSSARLWDVQNKFMCQYRKFTSHTQGRWVEHPTTPDCLVMVCNKEVHVFKWEGLHALTPISGLRFHRDGIEEVPTTELHSAQRAFTDMTFHPPSSPPKHSDPPEHVSSIIRTRDGRFLIFECGPLYDQGLERRKRNRIELFCTLALNFLNDGEDHRIPLQESISGLSGMVSKVIGSYQNQVVFFNHRRWLCSWEVNNHVGSHQKHLSLPQDWLNLETLHLTTLTPSGTLLFPRNGEVAIIKGWIKI